MILLVKKELFSYTKFSAPNQENKKLPAKGPRPSAGSKIHFKL